MATLSNFSLRLSGRQAAQSRAVLGCAISAVHEIAPLGLRGGERRAVKLLEAPKFGRASESRRPPGAAREGRLGSACSVGVHGLLGEALLGRGRVGGDALRGARAVARRVPVRQPAIGRIYTL